jgi:glyoxylase-like metal-dependent hydrolase (beta-lactamase superfamily II)
VDPVTAPRRVGRRWLLARATRTALAVAVLGPACTSSSSAPGPVPTTGGASDGDTGDAATATSTGGAPPEDTTTDTATAISDLRWERADLGVVSAYVLVRGGEAAVVDTGTEGSADGIEEALTAAGVGWGAVGNVVLTHRHPDHIGSVGAVVERAPDAAVHAGAEDVPAVPIEGVRALTDGDRVFDLTIIATPGHTPGHVAVHDPAARLLVAGDALTGGDGSTLNGPNARFTPDMALARQSLLPLAELDVRTVLFGHGDPYTGDDVPDQIRRAAEAS